MNDKKNEQDVTQTQTIFRLEDDFSLIKDFLEGNEQSFVKLVNRHKDKVRNLIYLTLGNNYQVEDIAQDVFITVYRKLSQFNFNAQFSTWLYRITINKCKDHLRRAKLRSIFSPFESAEDEKYVEKHDTDEFEVKQIINDAIAQLPEKLRIPLVLRDIEGMSYQEIGDSLGFEQGTVKSRIFRAREHLRVLLEPYRKDLFNE